jgi:hypothetical protein
MGAVLANLKENPIRVMAVRGPLRLNPTFIAENTKRFGLSPIPVFNSIDAAIYVTPADDTPAAVSRAAQILYRYCGLKDFPISVTAGGPVDAMRVGSAMALVIPDPGEMVFDVTPDVVSVSGSFGIPKEDYSRQPKAAGAQFSIEYQSGGTKKILIERYLDPAGKREVRNLQGFALPMPSGKAGKLYFRTTNPGASDSPRLASWTGIEFHRAEQ